MTGGLPPTKVNNVKHIIQDPELKDSALFLLMMLLFLKDGNIM